MSQEEKRNRHENATKYTKDNQHKWPLSTNQLGNVLAVPAPPPTVQFRVEAISASSMT